MIRHLGYACQNLTLGNTSSHTFRLKNFSIAKANSVILANVIALDEIIDWNIANGIKLFRVSSELFPFMDHPEIGYEFTSLPDHQRIAAILENTGKKAISAGLRLTAHPGPYTCLGSPRPDIVTKAVKTMEIHGLMFKLLKTSDHAINIHVGGTYGDYVETAKRWIDGFNRVSPEVRAHTTLENDDDRSGWCIGDLMRIYERVGVPLVFDFHHWRFRNTMPMEQALNTALNTWPTDRIPKTHYSESRLGETDKKVRPEAHSDYVTGPIPSIGSRLFDVMVEAKAKDLALLRYLALTKKVENSSVQVA
jgi:UV DNA damage endonuclease